MPSSRYLPTSHDPLLVLCSVLIACLASYVALDMARRVSATSGPVRRAWQTGGSLAMGAGIWATHFVGMLGFDAGIDLEYRWGFTLSSLIVAVLAAAMGLWLAVRRRLTRKALAAGSLVMATGISAMHFLGMSAIQLQPEFEWDSSLVALSMLIAWIASAGSLATFTAVPTEAGGPRMLRQAQAAAMMAAGIGGMHYTAMAAVRLPAGAVCITQGELGSHPLAVLVTVATLLTLGSTLLLSMSDAVARSRESRLASSLHSANASLRAANDQLQRKAFEDALSGLPNRSLFSDRLHHAVSRQKRVLKLCPGGATEGLALLFIDLDGFKLINDSFGHASGDQVLREVSQRLHHTVRGSDTLARLGGDEFVALVESADAARAGNELAQRMIEALRTPCTVGSQPVSLSCSVGIAVFPDDDPSGEKLLSLADSAMYAAKRAGGSTWARYDVRMAGNAFDQVRLQQELRQAIEHGELRLYFQPKVAAATGKVAGWEALIRWQHPSRGLVGPAVFIPLAERFGLIGTIGNWVVEQSCAQLADWKRQGFECRIAINVSPHQLRQPELATRIQDALARHHLSADHLVCEITESAIMENTEDQRGMLQQLAALGVCLSIDDFGTGYSSLAHLRNIPARQLKIDRSFVVDLAASPQASAVLEAIVRLAHALRMEVVAEGVETAAQEQAVTRLGCDLLQGYHFAKPMPAHEVRGWMIERHRATAAGS